MTSLNGVRKLRLTAKETLIASCEVFNTVEPRFTDTRLIRAPRYYGQFSLIVVTTCLKCSFIRFT